MAKSKSRVSKSANKAGLKFKWWMGVGIVALIAVIGIAVVRFSQASQTGKYFGPIMLYCAQGQCYGGSTAHLQTHNNVPVQPVYNVHVYESRAECPYPHHKYYFNNPGTMKTNQPFGCVIKTGT